MTETPYELLLHYAHHRDDESLDRLVPLYLHEFAAASRLAPFYGIFTGCLGVVFVAPALIKLQWTGCAIALGLVAIGALLHAVDRWRRRRATRRSLQNAKPIIYRKLRIGAIAPDTDMFQSYWKQNPDDRGELELDHPLSLRDTVERADEWWQWLMETPRHDSNKWAVDWLPSHHEIGLVKRRSDGTPELLAGGQIYYDYDPWADRVVR